MSTHDFPRQATPAALPQTQRRVEGVDPIHLGSLDVRGLNAHIEDLDGDLVMLVDDGDVEIEFSSGLGSTWEQAIVGVERIAAVAQQYAVELRQRRPSRSEPPR